jgi:hypothetical protein
MTGSGVPTGTPTRSVSTWVISLVPSGTRICATVTPTPWIIAENKVTWPLSAVHAFMDFTWRGGF